MKYKRFKLNVCPAVEVDNTCIKTFEFPTRDMLVAAKESIADMFLFMQDEALCMDDYSNYFSIEVLPMVENAEWKDVDEDDLMDWCN